MIRINRVLVKITQKKHCVVLADRDEVDSVSFSEILGTYIFNVQVHCGNLYIQCSVSLRNTSI